MLQPEGLCLHLLLDKLHSVISLTFLLTVARLTALTAVVTLRLPLSILAPRRIVSLAWARKVLNGLLCTFGVVPTHGQCLAGRA